MKKPTDFEVKHYRQLIGKKIVGVQFQDMQGEHLPILVFADGSSAAIWRDPENNGPGWLDYQAAQPAKPAPLNPSEVSIFDRLVRAHQDIQKQHPFGSPEHRNAYNQIRKLTLEFKGIDIGEYA